MWRMDALHHQTTGCWPAALCAAWCRVLPQWGAARSADPWSSVLPLLMLTLTLALTLPGALLPVLHLHRISAPSCSYDAVSRDIIQRWTFPFVPDTNMLYMGAPWGATTYR